MGHHCRGSRLSCVPGLCGVSADQASVTGVLTRGQKGMWCEGGGRAGVTRPKPRVEVNPRRAATAGCPHGLSWVPDLRPRRGRRGFRWVRLLPAAGPVLSLVPPGSLSGRALATRCAVAFQHRPVQTGLAPDRMSLQSPGRLRVHTSDPHTPPRPPGPKPSESAWHGPASPRLGGCAPARLAPALAPLASAHRTLPASSLPPLPALPLPSCLPHTPSCPWPPLPCPPHTCPAPLASAYHTMPAAPLPAPHPFPPLPHAPAALPACPTPASAHHAPPPTTPLLCLPGLQMWEWGFRKGKGWSHSRRHPPTCHHLQAGGKSEFRKHTN